MEAQQHLLQGLPNEITELILCLLNTEHLLQWRLLNKGFAHLVEHSSVLWNNRIKEVAALFMGGEPMCDSLPPFEQYRTLHRKRKEAAGKFSEELSSNALLDRNTPFTMKHAIGLDQWTNAVIGFPQMIRRRDTPQPITFGIRIRVVEFKGNALLGLLPLEMALKYKEEGTYYSLFQCPRAYHITYWGSFHKGQDQLGTPFEGDILKVDGNQVEMLLDVGRQQVHVRRGFDRTLAASKIYDVQLEEDVVYCWAISAGMEGSEFVVLKAWAFWNDGDETGQEPEWEYLNK